MAGELPLEPEAEGVEPELMKSPEAEVEVIQVETADTNCQCCI